MSDETAKGSESPPPISSAVHSPELLPNDDVRKAENSEIFAPGYTVSRPTTSSGLPDLPEDAEVSEFQQPQVDIVLQEIAPDVSDAFNTDPIQSAASLMPSSTLSPNMRRRSSSAAGHRRRPSGQSNGSIASPNLRRRSSVISNGSKNEFDDFQEGDNDGSDFGDFDDFVEGEFEDGEVFSEEETNATSSQTPQQVPVDLPDVNDAEAVQRYVNTAVDLFFGITKPESSLEPVSAATRGVAVDPSTETTETPPEQTEVQEEDEEEESPFMLTDRAISLWRQLTAPPPLQPPDWKRSRIRRLFLVSLGIPVDLDEILPKMTHKKLVLPSTRKHREKRSNDERRSRKKIPPPPEFEILGARQLCSTTKTALSSMTEHEIAVHVATLRAHTTTASGLLQYWLEQRDAAQSEKETFEQVIQNLVQYHKKQKDEQKEASSNTKKSSRSRFSMMRS